MPSFKYLNGTNTIGTGTYKFKHINYETPTTNTYLTFSSPTSFTIAKHTDASNDGTVQYSTNKTTWSTFTTTAVTSVLNGSNYEVYFRGIGNTYVKGKYESFFVITGSSVSCNGNIETILDYATVDAGNHPTMANNCYANMFRNCTSLTTAPTLPATTLATACYFYMFYNCTSLTSAPALPATALADNCYEKMFYGCTSLKLSATQTGNYAIPYRIPTSGTGTVGPNSLSYMFTSTGGTFTGSPTINTTYYLWSE